MKQNNAQKLPFNYAKQHGVLVEKIDADSVSIAHRPEITANTLLEIRRNFKKPLKLREVTKEEFETILAKKYETTANDAMEMIADMEDSMDLDRLVQALPKPEDLLDSENDAPIIKLINALFTQAIKQNASDIHIETFEKSVRVRFRVDGVLQKTLEPPRVLAPLLVSRIKVMAKLNIAEKRLPQDGRITLQIAGRPIDVRVSTLPSSHGERVVMRLLDKRAVRLNLTSLGMEKQDLSVMQKLIEQPNGVILVTGPTGSGKTTTLYAALTDLNKPSRNILTVEDPVEYHLPGIGQTQVNPKINMSFSQGLRSILRQDPDIIMVGEIRDKETAEIAVQASLTGHLVLSTLHTNSAVGAITRLRDMGVQSYLLASTLIGVTAQRLVRKLCDNCKEKRPAVQSECNLLTLSCEPPPIIYQSKGCEKCGNTGFKGRTGIYETIALNETLQAMIHKDASEFEMDKYARTLYPSIQQDGFSKVLAGITTLEEVLRVTVKV